MLRSLAAFYVAGYPVDWSGLYSSSDRNCVTLPTYPWQRERCWFGDEEGLGAANWFSGRWSQSVSANQHPLQGRLLKTAFPSDVYYWMVEVNRTALPFLNDYRFQGSMVLPSATYIEIIFAAAVNAFGAAPRALSDIEFQKPLVVPEDGSRELQVVLTWNGGRESAFRVYSRASGDEQPKETWLLHATGKIPLHSTAGQ